MTIEEILCDIKSDRVKKVILDSDMGIELDDQYALAHCIGCDKIDLLSVNAETFGIDGDNLAGMNSSYDEIGRVLRVCGKIDDIPFYKGAEITITKTGETKPIISDSVHNIIKTVLESDEIVYVLGTGCSTNITSAILLEPKIKKNMCVIWLAGGCLDRADGTRRECNIEQDFVSAQLLINSGVPMAVLPAYDCGTVLIKVTRDELDEKLPDDTPHEVFFRDTLVEERGDEGFINRECGRVIFDVAAPAALSCPDAFDFRIIPAPVITDNGLYAFDSTRHKIIWMYGLDTDKIVEDMFKCIRNI